MFSRLSSQELCALLENFIAKPSHVGSKELEELLELFPLGVTEGEKNPNFLIIKLLRLLKDEVDTDVLSSRLSVDYPQISQILNNEGFEVSFPVSNGRETLMIKALVIPTEEGKPVSTEPVNREALNTLKALSRRSFLLSFSHGFDFRTNSYMLAVFGALRFGEKAQRFAFTGALSPDGKIERVKHLQEKLAQAKKEKLPLVFPSDCMENISQLESFMEDLRIPVAILPPKDPSPAPVSFESSFAFPPDYLRMVFHIEEPLIYTEPFDNDRESFERFVTWLGNVVRILSELVAHGVKLSVAITSKVIPMSFVVGVKLSKGRIPSIYYEYRNNRGYIPVLSLQDEHSFTISDEVKRSVLLKLPKVKPSEIVIYTKNEPPESEELLAVKLPMGEFLSSKVKEIAGYVQSVVRSSDFGCAHLKMEVPNSFSFALGYMLEDYKCLVVNHFVQGGYVPVYMVGSPQEGPLYLLNTFSLNMLECSRAFVEVKELSTDEAKGLLESRGFVSYVSHPSTAQVLSELLGRKVEYRRENLRLPNRAGAIVFQIRKRPPEGGIFTTQELEEILDRKLYTFYRVDVFY